MNAEFADFVPLFIVRAANFISEFFCTKTSTKTNRKIVLSQGNRAMPQLFFSPTTFNTSLRVAKVRKPRFRTPACPHKTEFNAKWPFKVIQGYV